MKILNFNVYFGNISSIKNTDNAISIFSGEGLKSVSYTHLTLPTILLV